MSVTKDLGNYVLSGTLHVTLSPEEAKNIQWQERAVDEAIEKTTALMPEVTEQASRLVQQREDIGTHTHIHTHTHAHIHAPYITEQSSRLVQQCKEYWDTHTHTHTHTLEVVEQASRLVQ